MRYMFHPLMNCDAIRNISSCAPSLKPISYSIHRLSLLGMCRCTSPELLMEWPTNDIKPLRWTNEGCMSYYDLLLHTTNNDISINWSSKTHFSASRSAYIYICSLHVITKDLWLFNKKWTFWSMWKYIDNNPSAPCVVFDSNVIYV